METITLLSPTKNEKLVLANDEVMKWYENYQPVSVGDNYGKGDHFAGKSVLFSWFYDKKVDYYVVEIMANDDTKNTMSFRCTTNSLSVDNLNVYTNYTWSVTAYIGNTVTAKGGGNFSTQKTPRAIMIDGVSNTRDIAFFSNKLKQGMLYRTATFDNITKQGIIDATQKYGIKTDIDLRVAAEGTAGTSSPLGDMVNYYNLSGAYYVDSVANIKDPVYQKNMADTIKLMADEKNYPIAFHCAIGRDRTGTLAAILEAFFGAEYEDIMADYEMSFFSASGCLDGATNERMNGGIVSVYDYLRTYANGSIAENAAQYLKDIGVSATDLSAVKRIMTK